MKHHLNTALGIVLYLIVVVLLNAAATSLFFRFDLTQNKIYTLSDASKNAVATLQEPLTIKAFFSKNMPAPYNNIEQQVRDLLEEYAHWGNEFFNYSFYSMGTEEGADPDRVSEYEAMARSYFIVPIQIEKVEKDEVKLVRAYMGLAFLHGDLLETIPAVTSADRLEFTITQTIQTLNERVSSLMNLKEDIQVR
ncbi:MAG: GldG family protein, partial [Spirochaetia bacterium]